MKRILMLFAIIALAFAAYAADIATLTKNANAGSPHAQYELGMAYLNGEGVDADPAKAVNLFEKAAKQGHPEAQYELGTAIFFGDGVNADKIMGCAWLYLSTVDSSEYICLSQINAEERAKAQAESAKLAATIKK